MAKQHDKEKERMIHEEERKWKRKKKSYLNDKKSHEIRNLCLNVKGICKYVCSSSILMLLTF